MRLIGIEAADNGDLVLRLDQFPLDQAQAIALLVGESVVVVKAAPPAPLRPARTKKRNEAP